MGNNVKGACQECTEEDLKACEKCSGFDALAPAPIVVQSFGLPASHSFGRDPEYEEGFEKVPVSTKNDWQPHRGYEYDDFRPVEESIAGNPSLPDAAGNAQREGQNSKMKSVDENLSPTSSAARNTPKAKAAPAVSAPIPMEEAPTPEKMEPSSPQAEDVKKPIKAWRKDLSLHEVLEDTWWCYYCFCYGCGCMSEPTHPKCSCDCVCYRSMIEAIPCCQDGCCQCVNHCVCCTCLAEFPAQERTPCCLWCGDPCLDYCPRQPKLPGGKDKAHGEPTKEHPEGKAPTLYQGIFFSHDTCFCCCFGCGQCCVPDCQSHQAWCCHRTECGCGMPSCENGCCNCLLTWANLYSQCWLPPQYHFNPCCAICGLRCRMKERDKKHAGLPG